MIQTTTILKKLESYISGTFYPKVMIANRHKIVGDWESDLLMVSQNNEITEYEIKTSKSDYLADFKKEAKHNSLDKLGQGPNYFYYVCEKGVIEKYDVPNYAGLIYILPTPGKCVIIKKAPVIHTDKMTPELWETIAIKLYN